jgi:erythromycin esterase-like protein
MTRFLTLIVVGLAVSVAGGQGQPPTDWIRANAIRLATVESGHGFADMQPLKAVVGDARVVSLGEATHGTREFFQLKHRMLEFLASEMGFTIFSIEANMPEAYRLNDYVLKGTGDPVQLLKGMYFWTWDTEEVLDMIRWMRAFNASGKGRIEFTGFDMQTPTVALQNAAAFVTRYDPTYALTWQTTSSDVTRAASAPASSSSGAPSFGLLNGMIPAGAVAGKKVRFSGFIKTEDVKNGYAGLWFRANSASGVVAFDNMQNRGATGTADWKQYVIDLSVPATVTNIVFGALMPGSGRAWFDDFAVEIDGQPYSDASFDYTFESPGLNGFMGGGNGYRVELDSSVAHSGKQSVRMTSAPAPAAPSGPSVDFRAVIAELKDAATHLETGRAGYRAAGAGDDDVDWAIQNVRVALQSLQMKTNEVSRDRSMANNVKWILDRNPKAKVVLWAHNGHVATGGGFMSASNPSMGGVLRQMLGRAMCVFGFAFNQGSFQAVPQNGGALKDFTVSPLAGDSLDATLATASIPVFAIDLRGAPDWFKTPRRSREIGAVYPDGVPEAFAMSVIAPDAFDAMLFVESTTAAKKNPAR